MRIPIAAAAFLALAACGQRSGADLKNDLSGRSGLPTPPSRPSGDARADLSSDATFRRNYRSINIQTCINSSRTQSVGNPNIPAGTDFRPYCTCFIDRSMAGLTVDQLANINPGPREERIAQQCAREQGFAPDGAGALDAGGDDTGGQGGK